MTELDDIYIGDEKSANQLLIQGITLDVYFILVYEEYYSLVGVTTQKSCPAYSGIDFRSPIAVISAAITKFV